MASAWAMLGWRTGVRQHASRPVARRPAPAWWLLAVVLAAGGAFAQAPVGSPTDGQGADDVLDEIIVTAQYRKQDLQKTALAMSALGTDTIASRGMVSVLDIAAAVPNVTMTLGMGSAGNSNQTFIRGIGRDDTSFSFDPRTSIYVDDVYQSTLIGSLVNLLDVERVEVLRGPQGTLFGRNTIGGAVRIITQKPRGDGSGYLQATAGSFDRIDVRGSIDLPLVRDTLFLRLAAGWQQRDGHVDRLNFACANPSLAGNLPVLGIENDCRVGTLGADELFDARVVATWIINDSVETTLTFEYVDDDLEPPADVVRKLALVNEATGVPAGIPNGLALWLQQVGATAYGLTPDQTLLDALQPAGDFTSYAIFGNPGLDNPANEMANPPVNSLDSQAASLTIDWQLGDSIALKSITAYRDFDNPSSDSVLALPISEIAVGSRQRQFSQELRLTGSALNDRVDWALGAFYLDTTNNFDGRVNLQGFGVFIPGPNIAVRVPFDFLSDDTMTVDNRSVFAHSVWHLTDRLNLTAAARFTNETKGYTYFRQNVGQPPSLDTSAPDTTVHEFNPRLALDYSWAPGWMAYASYSTGFTAGGFNPRPFTPADAELAFGTENATAWEVGLKSELLGSRLRVNSALFLTYFDDVQLQVNGCPVGCKTTSPFYYDNGGDARVRGFEIELSALPVPALEASAYVGYTEFEWVRFDAAIPVDVTLDSPQYKAPEWNAGLSAQYDIAIGRGGELTPRVDATYRSVAYFGSDRNTPELRQDGYTLINVRLAWQPASEHWSVAVAVSNATNEVYYQNLNNFLDGFGYALGQVARPREWSATVAYRF